MNDTPIIEEFLQESAIAQDVFDCAVSLVPDIEIDYITKEVIGTPLYDLLDWKYTRFGHQAKPNLIGAFFLQETGDVWQAKVFGQDAGKRSGRYYAPKGIGDKVYFPPVPQRVRELVAQKHGLREPKPTESFWEWVSSHPQIPITLTEGGKKALAAISQGEVAVSLYGCLCGALSMSSEGNPIPLTLIQELQPNAANGRPITIAFDQDLKPKAKQSVAKGTRRLVAIENGEKVIIHASAQKSSSKWSTTNLESLISKNFPDKKILRIDAQSIADPNHPAYGCTSNLNGILPLYDVVIASPTIETGVSIEIKHFDGVWALAGGVQTVDAVCQALERVRDDIPRHLWAVKRGLNFIGNGSTSIKALLRSQHKLTQANISLLQQVGINEFDGLDVNFQPESLLTWAKRACVVNAGMAKYRESILAKLTEEGYEIVEPNEPDTVASEMVNQQIKLVRDANYQQHCSEVSQAPLPTDRELEELDSKRAKTFEERLKERKGKLAKRYETADVSPELVKADDNGWYPKLQLHYFLTIGKAFLRERDSRSLSQMAEDGGGKVFKPDLNKRLLSAKVKALEVIGIEQFLDPSREFTSDDRRDWLDKLIQIPHFSQIDLRT